MENVNEEMRIIPGADIKFLRITRQIAGGPTNSGVISGISTPVFDTRHLSPPFFS